MAARLPLRSDRSSSVARFSVGYGGLLGRRMGWLQGGDRDITIRCLQRQVNMRSRGCVAGSRARLETAGRSVTFGRAFSDVIQETRGWPNLMLLAVLVIHGWCSAVRER